MTFVFGWGNTDIQQQFRKSEIEYLTEAQVAATQDDPEKVIDYQVSSNERMKHITSPARGARKYGKEWLFSGFEFSRNFHGVFKEFSRCFPRSSHGLLTVFSVHGVPTLFARGDYGVRTGLHGI